MTKIKAIILSVFISAFLIGCAKQERVSSNINQFADNFSMRRLEVINVQTGTPILEVIGNFYIRNNTENELAVTVKLENYTYKRHYVHLAECTMYILEDLSSSQVPPYHYEINVLPQKFQTFELIY